MNLNRYDFSIQNDFPNHKVALDRFLNEIANSEIPLICDHAALLGDVCSLYFKAPLSGANEVTLCNLVRAHSGEPLTANVDPLPPGKNVIGAVGGIGTGDYGPSPYERNKGMGQADVYGLNQDGDGNLEIRGAVYTDEGSFRDDFDVHTVKSLTGTVSFKRGSRRVTGTNTKFLSELSLQHYVKLEAEESSFYTKVIRLISDSEFDIAEQSDSDKTGTAVAAQWIVDIQGSATIEVAESKMVVNLGTEAGNSVIAMREGDYGPLTISFRGRLSQRLNGQEFILGLMDDPHNPTVEVSLRADGADPSVVKLVTRYGNAVEIQPLKVPRGTFTFLENTYQIVYSKAKATLHINGIPIGLNSVHLPGKYEGLQLYFIARNLVEVVSNTLCEFDYVDFDNYNELKVSGTSSMSWDGRQEIRVTPAANGARLREKVFSFYTARPSTDAHRLHNVGPEGPIGDITYKLFKSSTAQGFEVLEPVDDDHVAEANVTILDWEPPYNFEVMAGSIFVPRAVRDPEVPTHKWFATIIGVPDFPSYVGGSVDFCTEVDLELSPEVVTIDGKATTFMAYDPYLHTNKLRFMVRHPEGVSRGFQFFIDTFR